MNIRVRENNCSIYISCSQKSAEHLTNMSPKAVLLVVGLLALISVKSAEAKNWALLVAGSNTYDNYRHQADILHAYHVLRNHGFPKQNIITMMYDDIANNPLNPYPGNVINQPDGPNVYPGVVIDYKGEDVTPEMFLAVLSGDAERLSALGYPGGRVINSGPNDHVFVNFADHGGPGILAFPDDMLHAGALEKTLKKMYKQKKYKKLVLYVEACESGSIFASKLPKSISIFASTAANPYQSSYACYFDDKRQTYLGDVYSVNWMQDSDKENLESETLAKQFKIVRQETNTSKVCEYGDMSITSMVVAEFQGNETSAPMPVSPRHPTEDAVPAPDVPLKILEFKYKMAKTHEEKRRAAHKISDLMEHQSAVDQLFQDIVGWLRNLQQDPVEQGEVMHFTSDLSYDDLVVERRPITQWDCYEQAVDTLRSSCANLKLHQDYYALHQLFVLVNLCERGYHGYHIRGAVLSAARDHRSLCGRVEWWDL